MSRRRSAFLTDRRVVVGALVFALVAFVTYVRHDRTTTAGDIALYLNPPVRMLAGELPHRDFWML